MKPEIGKGNLASFFPSVGRDIVSWDFSSCHLNYLKEVLTV